MESKVIKYINEEYENFNMDDNLNAITNLSKETILSITNNEIINILKQKTNEMKDKKDDIENMIKIIKQENLSKEEMEYEVLLKEVECDELNRKITNNENHIKMQTYYNIDDILNEKIQKKQITPYKFTYYIDKSRNYKEIMEQLNYIENCKDKINILNKKKSIENKKNSLGIEANIEEIEKIEKNINIIEKEAKEAEKIIARTKKNQERKDLNFLRNIEEITEEEYEKKIEEIEKENVKITFKQMQENMENIKDEIINHSLKVNGMMIINSAVEASEEITRIGMLNEQCNNIMKKYKFEIC